MVLGGPPPGRLVPELLAASGCLPPLMLSLECRRGLSEPPPRSRGCTVDPDLARSPLLIACQHPHTAGQSWETALLWFDQSTHEQRITALLLSV